MNTQFRCRGLLGHLIRICAATCFVLAASTAASAQHAITAQWDSNTDTTTAGYRLYYGTSSGSYPWSIDAGNETSATLNLSTGLYYLVVRAYNAAYQEGPPSGEVSFSVGTTSSELRAVIRADLTTATSALVGWYTSDAATATLNGVAVALSGSATLPVSGTATFTIVARSASGAMTSASATVSDQAPLQPVNMTAVASRTQATLSWQRNSSGGAPTDYLLYVGTSQGASNVISARSLGNVLTVTLTLPPGSYYARVRASNAYGVSFSSNQASFTTR